MLHIKHKHHFSLPHIELPRQMDYSPVLVTDDDELVRAIENDSLEHDNAWELSERPDSTELTTFWQTVEDDILSDPKWIALDRD